jgi:hypothetical protein
MPNKLTVARLIVATFWLRAMRGKVQAETRLGSDRKKIFDQGALCDVKHHELR